MLGVWIDNSVQRTALKAIYTCTTLCVQSKRQNRRDQTEQNITAEKLQCIKTLLPGRLLNLHTEKMISKEMD